MDRAERVEGRTKILCEHKRPKPDIECLKETSLSFQIQANKNKKRSFMQNSESIVDLNTDFNHNWQVVRMQLLRIRTRNLLGVFLPMVFPDN